MAKKKKNKDNGAPHVLPKIKMVDGEWDGGGKLVKIKEIEVQGHSLKECEKTVDKYRRGRNERH